MRYLLDTNIISDLVRNPQGANRTTHREGRRRDGMYEYPRCRRIALWQREEKLKSVDRPVRSDTRGNGCFAFAVPG